VSVFRFIEAKKAEHSIQILGGWAGYFRYGNSAQSFDKITLHAVNRLSIFVANRHQRDHGSGGGSSPANPRTISG
jgi:hypothetical protein